MKMEGIVLPDRKSKVLLHSCCAPCSSNIIQAMVFSGIKPTIFFYNPNIHPKKEYEIRKNENIRHAKKLGVDFIDADYDVQNWFKRVKGLEFEPERGARCTMCFDIRLERTALYAYENDFEIITSSLCISRWKNMEQINESGKRAVAKYPKIRYWTYNWRKRGSKMYEIAKEEHFYKQEYCGCSFSLRDTNQWRVQNDKREIEIGKNYY